MAFIPAARVPFSFAELDRVACALRRVGGYSDNWCAELPLAGSAFDRLVGVLVAADAAAVAGRKRRGYDDPSAAGLLSVVRFWVFENLEPLCSHGSWSAFVASGSKSVSLLKPLAGDGLPGWWV